jgi:hypothetical protein
VDIIKVVTLEVSIEWHKIQIYTIIDYKTKILKLKKNHSCSFFVFGKS